MRTFTNKGGVEYDADKTDILYAEDLNEVGETLIDFEERISALEAGENQAPVVTLGVIPTNVEEGAELVIPFTLTDDQEIEAENIIAELDPDGTPIPADSINQISGANYEAVWNEAPEPDTYDVRLGYTDPYSLYDSDDGEVTIISGFDWTDLVSCWNFDHESGNALDSVGNNDLVNNGAIPYVAAKIGNGADLEKDNSQHFSLADASQVGLENLTKFSISIWFKAESLPASEHWIGLFAKGILYQTGNRSHVLAIYNTGSAYKLYFYVFGDVDRDYWTVTNYIITPVTGNWYHFVATFDGSQAAVADKMHCYLNAVDLTKAYAAFNGVSATYCIDSAGDVEIGKALYDTGVYDYADGVFDIALFFSRVLSAVEVETLFNSGNGITHA